MASFDKNMSGRESLMLVASAFMAIILGIFVFVVSPWGVVIIAIGLATFACGYYQVNPLTALSRGK